VGTTPDNALRGIHPHWQINRKHVELRAAGVRGTSISTVPWNWRRDFKKKNRGGHGEPPLHARAGRRSFVAIEKRTALKAIIAPTSHNRSRLAFARGTLLPVWDRSSILPAVAWKNTIALFATCDRGREANFRGCSNHVASFQRLSRFRGARRGSEAESTGLVSPATSAAGPSSLATPSRREDQGP